MEHFEELFSDDADVQEYLDHINRPRRPRVIRARPDHFNMWDDYDFFQRFRFTKNTVRMILNQIQERIAHPTVRNHAVSPTNMLLMTLRFYATGSFYICVGDFSGVHKSTVCKIVHRVSHAISQLRPRYIQFPTTEEEITKTRQDFYNINRFPRCIGAIDCTHVRLLSPGGDDGEIYRNRKGFFSLNVQGVCNAQLKLLNIVARWPGSSHDATIFNNCNLRARFENEEMGDSVILGDRAYPIRRYLLTPLSNPTTPPEQLYNESHIRTRNTIERCFGVWKRRFPVLALGIRLNLQRVEAVIVATAVLHNIACDQREEEPPIEIDVEAAIELLNFPDNPAQVRGTGGINNVTRYALVHDYFQQIL